MGYPKFIKGCPLRPIVCSMGTATCVVTKELAKILRPLVIYSWYHISNTQNFVDQVKTNRQRKGSELLLIMWRLFSYLFQWILPAPWSNTLQQDMQLHHRTSMSICHIIKLLEFCLKSVFFLIQVKHYEEVQGAALGSPISPIVTNPFMEKFKIKTINSVPKTPRLWLRYVDDAFDIQKAEYSHQLLLQINSIEPHIQFTAQTPNTDGSILFLDTLIPTGPDNSLLITVWRKPTNTDKYLYGDGHITTYLWSTLYSKPLHTGAGLFVPTLRWCTRRSNTYRGLTKV